MTQIDNSVLQKKSYAVNRIVRYITLLYVVCLFFLPLISISEEKEGLIATVNVSPFQLLTDTAIENVSIRATDGSDVNGFLGAIAEKITVNVVDEVFGFSGMVYIVYRVCIVLLCGVGALFVCTDDKRTEKMYIQAQQSTASDDQRLKSSIYLSIYSALPHPFDGIKFFFSALVYVTVFSFYFILVLIGGEVGSNYTANYLPVIIAVIINWSLSFIAGRFCAKDMKAIRDDVLAGKVFDKPYVRPTLTSDMMTIKCLFVGSETPKEKQADITEELYQYKKLLDDGIITEEEFQAKKEDILNNKKDL